MVSRTVVAGSPGSCSRPPSKQACTASVLKRTDHWVPHLQPQTHTQCGRISLHISTACHPEYTPPLAPLLPVMVLPLSVTEPRLDRYSAPPPEYSQSSSLTLLPAASCIKRRCRHRGPPVAAPGTATPPATPPPSASTAPRRKVPPTALIGPVPWAIAAELRLNVLLRTTIGPEA